MTAGQVWVRGTDSDGGPRGLVGTRRFILVWDLLLRQGQSQALPDDP